MNQDFIKVQANNIKLNISCRQRYLNIRCVWGLHPIADSTISPFAFLYGDGDTMAYGDLQEIIYGS